MDSYLGEIKLLPYGKAMTGWHVCDGTLLQITSNQALYSLLGIFFGGDGRTTFGLPDLQGRTPVFINAADAKLSKMGAVGGTENVTLTNANIPSHNHPFQVSNAAGATNVPDSGVFSKVSDGSTALYAQFGTAVPVDPSVIQPTGGGGAHSNMQPFLTLNYFICTNGFYPPRP